MINVELMKATSIINGKEVTQAEEKTLEVISPFNGEVVGKVHLASQEDTKKAIETAYQVFHETMKKMPAYRRADILRKTAELLEERTEEFARILGLEAGKPIRDGRGEVGRAVQVLRFAADEAKKIEGELVPMDAAIGGENRIGMVRRHPIGVISAITPFNFPLNLALHKLAPAFAAGNTVVLKPAGKTPLSSYMLVKLFEEAGLPKGALNLVIGNGSEIGDVLVTDPRISKVTFTGSPSVGMKLCQQAGLKKVTLELGSNSPNIIFNDGDLNAASTGLVRGAFAFSGQICISAQRIYVQREVYQTFLNQYVSLVEKLVLGNPMEETTDIGPMISEKEVIRAQEWIQEAVKAGAKVATGGNREGTLLEPTVLVDVTPDMKVVCEETFAPIVSVIPFDTEEEVIAMANDSVFGLQAGVFTSDINRAMRVADGLETGGVWINETSTYRQDNYPYGGVKLSGIGKEGVKYAIEDMTEIKFVGIKLG
ncbi:aldehyde dehydrogenase family protein [Metabacillus sediminilitoris]|uniref:3-sulfolactaldehyde dehydrogenase n=1 Tax=Metabacillus sediminilitoris TaxID=2567941 RepID=A0A4S4BKF4_9BACI|nr:aldehyde dehydrogenase family protein [Metabacillus sediminilitoris]QGQ45841.1 aldehyde dehydrogenase family protein [Metabacillus sediminilitoris]THF75202.1 aldehyde dehydrogenase family protein [Metabacillus sediminilitoris]